MKPAGSCFFDVFKRRFHAPPATSWGRDMARGNPGHQIWGRRGGLWFLGQIYALVYSTKTKPPFGQENQLEWEGNNDAEFRYAS